ncbi:MAG TPA: MOP flippase family protein [Methanocella sp.]|nr:MOP flippase family protein [Methanocella sp.]
MSDQIHVKSHAVFGAKWIGLSTIVTSAFQCLQVAILTRFLVPTDFGLMAMAMVVIGVAQAFTDLGVSNAVIQRRHTALDQLSTLYWLEILAGVILFGAMILITPYVVGFYHEPRISGVMIVTSIIFLVTPPGQLFQVLLQKELRFHVMSMVEISASFIGMISSIALAYLGFGVMALAIGQILYYGLRSIEYLVIGCREWKPRLHFRTSDLEGYIGFGMYQIGERIVTYLSINVINLIIGRYLGARVLGNYSIAYQMIINPILRANTVLMTVSFPLLSRYQGLDNLLQDGYLHMTRFIAFTTFPILTVVTLTAPVFVPVLLGPGWGDVIPLVQILCVVGLFKSLGATTVPTYLAKGRADIGFIWNFIVAAINALVFYLLTGYGIIVLTLAFAAISLMQFTMLQTITGKIIELSWRRYLEELTVDSLLSISMGAVIFGAYLAGRAMNISHAPLLALMVLSAVIVYMILLATFRREYIRELRSLMMPVKRII